MLWQEGHARALALLDHVVCERWLCGVGADGEHVGGLLSAGLCFLDAQEVAPQCKAVVVEHLLQTMQKLGLKRTALPDNLEHTRLQGQPQQLNIHTN